MIHTRLAGASREYCYYMYATELRGKLIAPNLFGCTMTIIHAASSDDTFPIHEKHLYVSRHGQSVVAARRS